ncbi:MAG: Unknown protein [uncultured Thiotrichaceae bacterium]|uniref:Uncharacterized protein n=1 Tax=uncultured Thiotrichaceae bacterium TaxID=298394 RepID=A0A6S6UHJ3_9GAMM|nr:MAG: Unknown protein [uncultured Thiotrichaceae bacterium]
MRRVTLKVITTNFKKHTGWSSPLPYLDSPQTLILIFGAPSFIDNHEPFLELKEKYPTSIIAGCSTAGEIFDDQVLDESLVVSFTRFTHTHLRLYTTPISDMEQSLKTGSNIAKNLKDNELSSVLVLTDGLLVNGTDFIKGVNSQFEEKILVTGGLAGDGGNFKQTWILADGIPQSGYACGIGFYGDAIKIDHGSQGGWKAFGPERLVTKSHNNVLYELDDKPALELYKGYLGEMADGLPATGLRYPLSLYDKSSNKKLVRTILAVNEDEQSLTFAGDIPNGHSVQLMYATFDNLIDGAEDAAKMLDINATPEQEVLAIAISCVGRRMVMEEDPGAELEAVKESLPEQTKQVGFYSYGELSPCLKNGICDLHNQTMTLTTIYEQE